MIFDLMRSGLIFSNMQLLQCYIQGLGVAKRLGREGASIAILDIDKASLKRTSDALTAEGISNIALDTDITQSSQVKHSISEIVKRFNKVDWIQ